MYKDLKFRIPIELMKSAGMELDHHSKGLTEQQCYIKCDRFHGAICTMVNGTHIEITFTNEESLLHLISHLIDVVSHDEFEALIVGRTHYFSDSGFKPFTDEIRETDKKYLEAIDMLKDAFFERWTARGNEIPDKGELIVEIGINAPSASKPSLEQVVGFVEQLLEATGEAITQVEKPKRFC